MAGGQNGRGRAQTKREFTKDQQNSCPHHEFLGKLLLVIEITKLGVIKRREKNCSDRSMDIRTYRIF